MSTPIRVLLLEDKASDAELMLAELRRAGFDPDWKRADTQSDFVAALDPTLELILAEYRLPQFTGLQALGILKERRLQIPFILVSGTVGEELAVQAVKEGASDYLLKDRLKRLGPAVANALQNQRMRDERRRAEQALVTSEGRFRALTENAPDAITLLSADGTALYDSPAAPRLLGYDDGELIGQNAFARVHPADLAQARALFERALREPHTPVKGLIRFRRKDGSWAWIEASASNLLDNPAVQAVVLNYRDVSMRKRTEEALRASEARYRSLVETQTDLITRSDPDGRLTFVNDAYCQTFGIRREELIGKVFSPMVLPEDLPTVEAMTKAIQAPPYHMRTETRHRTPSGVRWFSWDNAAVLDDAGRIVELQGIGRDITERKEAEAARQLAETARRAAEDKFRLLTEQSFTGVYIIQDGQMAYVNPAFARIFGYEPGEIIGKLKLTDLIHPDDLAAVMRRLQERLAGAVEQGTITYRALKKDGSTIHIEVYGVLSEYAGRPAVLGTLIDVTQRKQTEVQREALLEIMTGMASTHGLSEFLELLRQSVSKVMPAENLFVVLYDAATGEFEEVFTVDKYDSSMPPGKLEKSITSYVFRTGEPLLVTPAKFQELLARGEVDLVGRDSASWLGAPLRTPQATIGVIAVQDYDRPDCYTERDREFLASVGAQVALAIERKRAEDDLQHRARELQTLYETSLQIAAETSLDRLLLAIVERAASLLGTDSGALYLMEPGGQSIRLLVVHQLPQTFIGTTLKLGEGMSGAVAQRGHPMQLEDYQTWPGRSPAWDGVAIRRVLALPLRAKDEMVGVINVADSRKTGSFSEDEIRLGTLFANQAAMAIQRTRAEREIGERAKELRTLYRLAELIERNPDLPELYEAAVHSLPGGWQYPEIACARIVADGREFRTDNFAEPRLSLSAPLVVEGAWIGKVEVGYLEQPPPGADGPFLQEERDLIEAIAERLSAAIERNRAAEKLAASEADLRALFEAMTDVVAVYDREGRYVQIAPTHPRNLDSSPHHVLGKHLHELFPKEEVECFLKEIETVLESGQAQQFEYRLTIEGKEVWFSAQAAPRSKDTVVWVAHDITNRKQAETNQRQQLQRIASLHSIDEATRGFFDIELILKVVLDQALAELGADAADFLLLDPVMQTLDFKLGVGFRTEALKHTRLPMGQGYAGRAALERRMVHVSELRGAKTDFLRSPTFAQEDFISYYGVPLVAKGVLKGVLEVFHRKPFEADAAWIGFLESLGGHAAVAIESTTLFKETQRSSLELTMAYDATIEGWSRALDLRDKETEGHTQRVAAMTGDLARRLGVPANDLVHIRRGALLHDIGKMGVPDSILQKPGPLTAEEWVVMKMHPQLAFQMLSGISYLEPALAIPHYHHEKWDGSGYPRGLQGEQIPLAARLFAVVDVWDALTSDRPYRRAWPEAEAREHIRQQRGKHFDPSVLDVFLQDIIRADTQRGSFGQ